MSPSRGLVRGPVRAPVTFVEGQPVIRRSHILIRTLTTAGRSYLDVLRLPHAGRPAFGAVVAALPIGVLGLAVLLMVQRAEAGFAAAGLVVGCLGLGTGLGMAMQGRLIDRWGQPPVLVGAAAVELSALVGLVIAAQAQASTWFLGFLAALAGAGEPQVVASLRALWADLVPDELRQVATATSTLLFEAPVLVGPLLLVVLLAVVPPSVVVLACGACFALGAVVMSTSSASRSWRNTMRRTGLLGPLASAGIRTVVVVTAGQGLFTGFLQVPAAAAAAEAGAADRAGLLYAALSAGSLLGAAVFGARRPPTCAVPTLTGLLFAASGAAAASAFAPTLPLLAVGLVAVGSCFGPMAVLCFGLTDRLAPPGTVVEAFTLVTAASLGAFALGTAAAGFVVDRAGATAGFITAAGIGVGLLGLIALRRRTLPPTP